MTEKADNNKRCRVHVKGHEGVILYPALVTPCLVEKGTGCMSIILAMKQGFYDEIHQRNPGGGKDEIGVITARTLHSQLAMTEWGGGTVPGPDEAQYIGHKRQVISQRNMIYSNHIAAKEKWEAGDYRGWYLGELKAENFLVIGYEEISEKKYEKTRKWGVLHASAAQMYVDNKYTRLFQLDFKNFDKVNMPKVYELVYTYFKLYDDKTDTPPENTGTNETGASSEPGANGESMCCCYTDPADDVVNDYFANDNLKQKPRMLRTPERILAHKIVGGSEIYRLYDDKEKFITVTRPDGSTDNVSIGCVSKTNGPFLQSRHPVYIPEKWEGRIGVVGDLHVSSRQSLYPLANAQVIPGADPKHSPYLGKITHQNASSARALMQEIAKQSDVLAIVGDLYDHTINCDPLAFADTVRTTGQLWQAMAYNAKHKGNPDAYPRAIDGLLLLSYIQELCKKKPVIYVSGNHEAYEHPYGITPRVRSSESTHFERANEVSAADHNLTFYEASLLYGRESYDLGLENELEVSLESEALYGGIKSNFRPKNYDWLYCLFSPWKDCVITYGAGASSYNFIALGWGGDERFLSSGLAGGDFLPRANEACTSDQVALTRWAATRPKFQCNILLSHFTFVCYAQNKTLNDKKAWLDISQPMPKPWDIGSFDQNRYAMYETLRGKGIQYSISGHSHRAGAYKLGEGTDVTDMLVIVETQGKVRNPENQGNNNGPVRLGGYKALVCGSAGPYSYQNESGELGGYGMDFPQGFVLNAKEDTVTWVKDPACVNSAPPRLAVVMDYLWYAGKCRPFSHEDILPYDGIHRLDDKTFCFASSNKFMEIFKGSHPFASITLIAVNPAPSDGEEPITLLMTPYEEDEKIKINIAAEVDGNTSEPEAPIYVFKLRAENLRGFKDKIDIIKSPQDYFLSITFRDVPGIKLAAGYDLNTPWCFPVKVYGEFECIDRPPETVGGEVADHKFYVRRWRNEYATPK